MVERQKAPLYARWYGEGGTTQNRSPMVRIGAAAEWWYD